MSQEALAAKETEVSDLQSQAMFSMHASPFTAGVCVCGIGGGMARDNKRLPRRHNKKHVSCLCLCDAFRFYVMLTLFAILYV